MSPSESGWSLQKGCSPCNFNQDASLQSLQLSFKKGDFNPLFYERRKVHLQITLYFTKGKSFWTIQNLHDLGLEVPNVAEIFAGKKKIVLEMKKQ